MAPLTALDEQMLDNPAYFSLTTSHHEIASRHGRAMRYPPNVSPFGGLPSDAQETDWVGLATLGTPVALLDIDIDVIPAGWMIARRLDAIQMVLTRTPEEPSGDVVLLGEADIEPMLALTAQTQPGPFESDTVLMGRYWGVKENGRLLAMAGERLQPPGWTEISAVCTAADARGRGLARRLVQFVAARNQERDRRSFLHVVTSNTTAIGLYESMGFATRRPMTITVAVTDPRSTHS